MTFPANYTRIWVRGRFIDLGKAARGEANIGLTKECMFSPTPKVLLDAGTEQIISTGAFTVTPDPEDGYMAILLPATNDPDINPTGNWTYAVTDPAGRSYNIVVPIETSILDRPGDPLDGEQVIDLIDVVPVPSPGSGNAQVVSGRGVSSIAINGSNHLIVTYTDATTQDVGFVQDKTPSVNIPDAVTITMVATAGKVFKTTIGADRTLGNPTGAYDGQVLLLIVEQGMPGGHNPVLGNKWRLAPGQSLAWSNGVGQKDRIMVQYDADDDKFDVLAFQPGYGA